MAQPARPGIASGAPATYAEAVDRYLGSAGVADSSGRIYRISLTTWAWLLAGEQPPARRRGAQPPVLQLSLLDEPGLPARLAAAFMLRSTSADADTLNRELSVLRAAVAWWQAQGWIAADPSRGLSRVPVPPPDRTRALTRAEVDAVFRLDVALREKTYWRLLYESTARADELLTLDVGDLDLPNQRARVVARRGAAEWIHWQTRAADLLPRLLHGRRAGPVFLTDRRAPSRTPALDVCPITGRARLSYRRAAELFTKATSTLDSTGAGWTLHQLRNSDLVRDAQAGASMHMLLARAASAPVRSLESYSGPGVDRSDLVLLRRARDQMDREYARPLDVEALARTACMSSGHFSRSFRAAYGETPYSYLMTRRIERAMALLRRGDLSVTEVCLEVGCASLGTFSARFTELVGESPSAYRTRDHSWIEPLPACLARAALRPVRNREAAATVQG